MTIDRRRVLKAGVAGAAALGFPGDRARAVRQDQDRASHADDRLPRRARRIRGARHPHGRGGDQQGRRRDRTPARDHLGGLGQSRDRRHQGAAHAGARRRDRADGRDLVGDCADDHAGRGAQQAAVHADRRALRRAARQELQQVHLPRRHPEHRDGQRGRQGAAARQHGEGQEVLHAHRRLRVRPRPAARRQGVLRRQRGQPDRRRAGRDRRHRLQPVSAEDPPGAARRAVLQSRRQPGHQPDQAVCRVRAALSDRRLQPQHRRRLGGGRGQSERHLADGLAPRSRHARPRRSSSRTSPRSTRSRRRTTPGSSTSRSR